MNEYLPVGGHGNPSINLVSGKAEAEHAKASGWPTY